MLIHAMIQWPEIIQESFWPFAVQLAIDIDNNTPNIFSGSKSNNILHHFHPFGCPIYILELSLHQNHKIPKWKPRSRVGVYLGCSPEHASSIPLIYSTTTGLVSPQFHVLLMISFLQKIVYILIRYLQIGQLFFKHHLLVILMRISQEQIFMTNLLFNLTRGRFQMVLLINRTFKESLRGSFSKTGASEGVSAGVYHRAHSNISFYIPKHKCFFQSTQWLQPYSFI